MATLKRCMVVAVAVLFLATPALAEENGFKSLFQDLFYGGLSGGLVGAAVLAFTKQPGKHWDYVGYGAAGGVLVGATYGAVSMTRSLAELENGQVTFSMPTIMPEIRESHAGHSAIVATAELLRGKF